MLSIMVTLAALDGVHTQMKMNAVGSVGGGGVLPLSGHIGSNDVIDSLSRIRRASH